MNESVGEDKKTYKKLVYHYIDVCFLIDLYAIRQKKYDRRLEKYEKSLKTSGEEEMPAKEYFRLKTFCDNI